jgi:hypothetical protein
MIFLVTSEIGERLRHADSKRRIAYTVAREQEVIAAKRPDIRVNSPHVASPVVIEVKIADNWTLSKLREGLKTQLIGQYLRDRKARNGVYLLTYHGRKASWLVKGTKNRISFNRIVDRLQADADRLVRRSEGFDAVRVVGIDLTANPSLAPAGQKVSNSRRKRSVPARPLRRRRRNAR